MKGKKRQECAICLNASLKGLLKAARRGIAMSEVFDD